MSKPTLQFRYLSALEMLGERVVRRTRKYVVVTRTGPAGPSGYYYLGNAGSVRYGRTYTESRAASDTFKAGLLA